MAPRVEDMGKASTIIQHSVQIGITRTRTPRQDRVVCSQPLASDLTALRAVTTDASSARQLDLVGWSERLRVDRALTRLAGGACSLARSDAATVGSVVVRRQVFFDARRSTAKGGPRDTHHARCALACRVRQLGACREVRVSDWCEKSRPSSRARAHCVGCRYADEVHDRLDQGSAAWFAAWGRLSRESLPSRDW